MDEQLIQIKEELIDIFEQLLEASNETISNNPLMSNSKLLAELKVIAQNFNDNIFEFIAIEKYIISFNLDEHEQKELYDIITVLKAFLNNKTLSIPNTTIEEIHSNQAFKKTIEELKEIIKKCGELTNNNKQLKEVLEYISKINVNDYFENIDLIDNFMRNNRNVDLYTKYRINVLVGEYNVVEGIKKSKNELNDTDIIKSYSDNRLSYESLKNIFEKYNYNIELVNEDIITRLLTLGNINDIDYIFSWFESIDLRLNETKKQDEKYFNMLYRSSEEIIQRMIDCSKELKVDIKDLFKKSFSAFINKSNKKGLKTINSKSKTDYTNISGSYEDFIENKKLIAKLGYDVEEAYKKCATIFVYPNKTLKENIEALEQYGINIKENHQNIKLSGLKNNEILFTIDQFIELDEFNYLRENTSRLQIYPNDVIFYRIYKAKKENINYLSAFNTSKTTYKSFITQDTYGNSFVGRNGKREDTNTITPNIFDKTTEEILNRTISDTNLTIDEGLINSDVIKKLDEKYLSKDQLAYVIQEKRYSKFKLLRLLTLLNTIDDTLSISDEQKLLYCLTYNSIITKEEFEKTQEELLKITKEKRLI